MPRLTFPQLTDNIKQKKAGSRCLFEFYERDEQTPVRDVRSAKDFHAQVERIAAHIEDVVVRLEAATEKKACAVRVGKTYAPRNRRHRAVDPENDATVRMDGLGSRWERTYKREHFDALVAVACFSAADVPSALRDHGADQEFVTLLYENAVECECSRATHTLAPLVDNKNRGGGGRRSNKLYAAYLLYVAIKFE